MLAKVGKLYERSILEPSAGKGDLADAAVGKLDRYYNRCREVVHCIEIEPELQAAIRGKGYPLVEMCIRDRLPVVSAVARGLSGVATRAGDLAQRFPRTTAVFMTGATVIAGLAVGGLALGLVINGVKTSVASLRSATLLLSNSRCV